MKDQNIIDGNNLIAKFMGRDKAFDERDKIYHYHDSWDWLKPAVDKIITTVGLKTIDECDPEEWFQYTRICQMYIGIDIKLAYHYVVEFIKWYDRNVSRKSI